MRGNGRIANRHLIANTDGADTFFSSNIRFNNWTIYNGDDSISMKANSTDISVTNSKFYNGLGIALGSIGQYKGAFETMERLHFENISYFNTLHAVSRSFWYRNLGSDTINIFGRST